jgi:hypothetical protein
MAIDKHLWPKFGATWVASVRAASIQNWLVAALDPETSIALGAIGAGAHCFNAPLDNASFTTHGKGCQAILHCCNCDEGRTVARYFLDKQYNAKHQVAVGAVVLSKS